MKKSGIADMPLHYGAVPPWLYERMAKLGLAITEQIIANKGTNDFLSRMSNPFWFQSLGAVMGMDWHSSGITTSVMGALKKAINPHSKTLGLCIGGGKGKFSRETPNELLKYADITGLDGTQLVRSSKLTAKVDNNALQDGFQLYQHSFIVNDEGCWTVVQQGMNDATGTARRYHWNAEHVANFTEEPHSFIYGENQGEILNLTDKKATPVKTAMLAMMGEQPQKMLAEISKLVMPKHHDVRAKDVDLKRLGAVLWLAQNNNIQNFDELILLEGLGPRTLQSLTLVSEVIYGTPSRFADPARFSFANGGKDGHPFPVPVNVYDETIKTLNDAIKKAKIGNADKADAIRSLSHIAAKAEKDFIPNGNFDAYVAQERANAWQHGGRTVFGKAKKPTNQLDLFA